MNQNIHEQLIAVFQHIRKRPGMYFSDDLPGGMNFLAGFNLACRLLDPTLRYEEIYHRIIRERGWEVSAMSVYQQMKQHGHTNEAIVDELLAIEIAVIEAISAELESTEKKA